MTTPNSEQAFEDVLNAEFRNPRHTHFTMAKNVLAAHQTAVTAAEVALLKELKGKFRMGRAGEREDPYAAKIIDAELRQRGAA